MNTIKPTIGRKVWYWSPDNAGCNSLDQAFDATVIYVWNPAMVNLLVTDHEGRQTVQASISISDPQGHERHGNGRFATWMPFQVGQAKAAAPVVDHASAVLYPAINAAMLELEKLHPGFNHTADRAYNILHRAFWSEAPAPVDVPQLRPEA